MWGPEIHTFPLRHRGGHFLVVVLEVGGGPYSFSSWSWRSRWLILRVRGHLHTWLLLLQSSARLGLERTCPLSVKPRTQVFFLIQAFMWRKRVKSMPSSHFTAENQLKRCVTVILAVLRLSCIFKVFYRRTSRFFWNCNWRNAFKIVF